MSDNIDSAVVTALANSTAVSTPETAQRLFTLFPRLPKELRVRIWFFAFPDPVDVRLEPDPNLWRFERGMINDSVDQYTFAVVQTWKDIFKKMPEQVLPPVTLQVNYESRQETLNHYAILFHQDVASLLHNPAHDTPSKRPFCFSPTRDTAFVPIVGFADEDCDFPDWLTHLINIKPIWAERLYRMKFTGLRCDEALIQDFKDCAEDVSLEEFHVGILGSLLRLPRLKTVEIICKPSKVDKAHADACRQELEKLLVKFFAKHRRHFIGSRIPTILLQIIETKKAENEPSGSS